MSVTEVASAIGDWGLKLRSDTPLYVLDKLDYFGHVAITAARVDPEAAGDSLLSAARYVGVLRDRSFGEANKAIGGAGMALWLGDEDDKGEILESELTFTDSTFTAAINSVLPDAVTAGTITALAGLYNGVHVFQSSRKVIDYICSMYDAEWRVNGDGTLDAGEIADLYVTDPKAAILRNRSGVELNYKALDGIASLDSDVKDFTTRVVLIAEGTEAATVSATVDILPGLNPYLDIHGNPVKRTRIISEQQTSEGNAEARAQLQLNRFTSPRDALKLSTRNYDIKGDVAVGDYVWVYDPDAKLIDTANPIDFHGQEIYPIKLRVFQISWPVVKGMGVAYRAGNGEWVDLSDYVEWETGETAITVGGYNRSLTGVGSGLTEDPGSRPITNSTIPGVVTWNTPFLQSTYQSDDDGLTRAQIMLSWDQPLNTDSSVITDGLQYEIRFRTGETSLYSPTHTDMAVYRHNQLLGPHSSPIPFTLGAWQFTYASWDVNELLMMDLTPGIPYDFQIRAIDVATPPNVGDWSTPVTVQTRPDTKPPSIPAAPANVAGSRNALQIVHTLGRASGGTYNLEADLNHFEVHAATDPSFVPSTTTLLGKLPANQGMIRAQIPAVGTFPLAEEPDRTRYVKVVAVDHFGNKSNPSNEASQTAELIDSAFISELTVSKVSAGTIQADWILAAQISTRSLPSQPGVDIGWFGIDVWNAEAVRTLQVDALTGDITLTGTVQTGVTGRRIQMSGDSNEIKFFPEVGETRWARLFSYIPANYPNDVALRLQAIDGDELTGFSRVELLPDRAFLMVSPVGNPNENKPLSSVQSSETAAFMVANEITGTGQLDFVDRAVVEVRNDSHVFLDTRDSAEVLTSQVHLGPTDIWHTVWTGGVSKSFMRQATDAFYMNVRNGASVDGGYLELGRGDTGNVYFGKFSANVDSYLRFRDADIVLQFDGSWVAQWNQNGTHSLGYHGQSSGVDYRAPIKPQDGDHIFFYWAGGTLNIGTGGSFIKTFVIDHPDKPEDNWLVHATVEAPEARVEYNGIAIVEDGEANIILPSYFEGLTALKGRVVQVTVLAEDDPQDRKKLKRQKPAREWTSQSEIPPPPVPVGLPSHVQATYPRNGRFTIYSQGPVDTFRVFWTVKAVRKDVPQFEVEPSKVGTQRMGDGPYTYLVENQ